MQVILMKICSLSVLFSCIGRIFDLFCGSIFICQLFNLCNHKTESEG